MLPATVTAGTDMLVLPVGVSRDFTCTSPARQGYAIVWGVNGTSATSPQFRNYIALGEEVHSENGRIQRNLTYTADARANNTHILCKVTHIYDSKYHLEPVDVNCTLQGKLYSK